MKRLTKKEEIIMEHFWDKGPLFVRELRELYPEPRPHFSTLSTQVRTLQEEGFIDHKSYGPTYEYFAKVTKEESGRNKSMLLRTMMERDLLSMFSVRTTLKGTDSPMVCVLPFLLS